MAQDLLEFFGNTKDGVFVVDAEQRIVVWNQAAQEILGHEPKDVLGRRCHQVLGAAVGEASHQCMQECNTMLVARKGSAPPTITCSVQSKDGASKWLTITHIAVPLGRPGQVALIHVFREVTQEVQARSLVDELVRYIRDGGGARPAALRTAPAPAPGDAPGQPPLTHRELDVLRLLAEGRGTAAVAERLVISASTARNHIQNILDKLRVHSRMEAVMFGIRQGLIVPAHDKHDSPPVLGRAPDR